MPLAGLPIACSRTVFVLSRTAPVGEEHCVTIQKGLRGWGGPEALRTAHRIGLENNR